jgi:prepilin peptidase CpaA
MMLGAGGMTTTACERAIDVRYLTGLTAMALALGQLRPGATLPLLFASAFLFLCCATDTFLGEIPNSLNLALILSAMFYHGVTSGAAGVGTALLGLLLGCALLLIPYLLGGMGGGDVKALAALGALLGPAAIFQMFLYTGLIGGGLALLHYATARTPSTVRPHLLRTFLGTGDWQVLRPRNAAWNERFPYAAALCFGFFAYHKWGGLL